MIQLGLASARLHFSFRHHCTLLYVAFRIITHGGLVQVDVQLYASFMKSRSRILVIILHFLPFCTVAYA